MFLKGDRFLKTFDFSENRKKITFTDKNNIGQVKLKGTKDLN